MDFYVNPNKRLEIDVDNKTYFRHAVKTHFIKPQEDYIELIKNYVSSIYEDGDILFLGEKIISLCQNRVCYAKDIKISKWAKFLSGFASSNNHGIGVDNPYKMQLAINFAGLSRVILAALCGGICRLFGVRGVFYSIVGKGVSGIDGFYGKAFEFYSDKGILLPDNCDEVCNKIELTLGIKCVIVDANDLGVEILGKSIGVGYNDRQLKAMVRDNPAGQSTQLTPMILVREQEPDQNLQEIASSI